MKIKFTDIITFVVLSFLSFLIINGFAFNIKEPYFDFGYVDCELWQYKEGGIDIITPLFILTPLLPFYIACFYKSFVLFKKNKVRSVIYFVFSAVFVLYWFYTYYARFMFYC
ncbi:hypothetical protein CKY10_06615 [Photorhabdus sp. HUG-39]|nr:hypothetical protein CKY10_06615 [Photorhabdus sp. HUG-39]